MGVRGQPPGRPVGAPCLAVPDQSQLCSAFEGLPPPRNHPERGVSGVWEGQNEAKAEMGF